MNALLHRYWPYVFLSLPMIILLLVGWQLSRFSTSRPASVPTGEREGSTILGLHITQHEGTRLSWILDAPQAVSHLDGTVDFEQPNLLLLGTKGGETHLQSGHGWVSERGDNAIFRQDVVMVDDRNRRLTTQSLHYQPELGILSSTEPFQLLDKGVTMQGVGFRMDQKDRKINVSQGVRTTFSELPKTER